MIDDLPRCFGSSSELYAHYHDTEWGVPVHDDRTLFEMLILEGAHAGLSWETVLKKRDGYRRIFHDFDVARVAAMTDEDLAVALTDPGIVRHRQKVEATRRNARIFMEMQREYGSVSHWLWSHVDGEPLRGDWSERGDIPATTPLSDAISKDLRKRGMGFVGPTIIYAYLQAVGVVNDHWRGCWISTRALLVARSSKPG
ncbi:DNA-3-methyladenine glycosylase I [Silicimonas algicola]|uniref:DNA-3-methyladenine glycosylase I n=1 Tax=Silicimonas algicola TaxID=1826607 RepID=A0A316G044_9RHOB|nr:DNA-3-methyladenine glycosylase I [Silicimonas algicola]AZQ69083.1 DNA-3-methyladenine glycosylase I [Silicimonas algicola]PWK54022.1 DNA-3-methyladenine glycosylase I [Silicimonas algicola]